MSLHNQNEFNPAINVSEAAGLAEMYSDKIWTMASKVSDSINLEDRFNELGIDTKGFNKDMAIKFMAAYGAFKIVQGFKGNIVKVGLVSSIIYFGLRYKESITHFIQNGSTPVLVAEAPKQIDVESTEA